MATATKVFGNVTGGGFNTFLINGRRLGYNDSASLKINPSKLEVKTNDFPKKLVKSIVQKVAMDLEANVKELTTQNVLECMSVKDNIVTNTLGSLKSTYWKTITGTWTGEHAYTSGQYIEPVTLNGYIYECTTGGTTAASEPTWPTTVGGTVTDGDAVFTCRAYGGEAVTMAPYMSGSLNYVQLTGYNITSTTNNKPIVYNSDYTEKYAEGTDYFVGYKTGKIYQMDGGDITDTQALKVLYKYTGITKKRINFKPEDFVASAPPVKLVNINPTTGANFELKFFSFQTSNTSIPVGKDISAIKMQGKINSVETRPNYSFGRIAILAAA